MTDSIIGAFLAKEGKNEHGQPAYDSTKQQSALTIIKFVLHGHLAVFLPN